MFTVRLICPRCRRNLVSRRLIAPGEGLRCPHCSGQFRAGLDEAPPSVARSNRAEPRRGHGILLAWLLFANLLILVGGSIAIAVVISHRAPEGEPPASASWHDLHEPVGLAESSKPTTPSPISPEDSAHPTVTDADRSPPPPPPAPVAPPSKPTPSADPPKPPPLSGPPPRPAERKTAAKEKPPEPAKPRAEDPHRPESPQAVWLPPNIQLQVDRSIDKGVEFLRRRQHADGSWGHQAGKVGKCYTPGITALSALTLLECGVRANDGHVRSAARYLRQRMPELTSTYSISLAILFFDRLGDKADAARIRTLALRLIAGQKTSGGWDYYCPTLSDDEELGLLALLYKDRPTTPLDLFAAERSDDAGLYRPKPSKVPPLELFVGQDPAAASADGEKQKSESPPFSREPKASAERQKRKADPTLPGDRRLLSKRALQAADKLSESLRRTPALRAADLLREPPDLNEPRTDNSNTQFAILGLLTAENYDVPMERAMALLDWRFRNSMTAQGGWHYRVKWPTTPAMTAAALMGLALKHGLLLPNRRGRGRDGLVHDDEVIHRGFMTLTSLLDNYFATFVFNQAPLDKLDLYCLWTIERVAVLYNVRTLGSLEWYPAGVQLILPLQGEDGSWSAEGTNCLKESPISSSFALLFLKRSNLARGLTERLHVPGD